MRLFRHGSRLLWLVMVVAALSTFMLQGVSAKTVATPFAVSVSPNPVELSPGPQGLSGQFDVQVQGATPNGTVFLPPAFTLDRFCDVNGLPDYIQADASGNATRHVILAGCIPPVFGRHIIHAIDIQSENEAHANFDVVPAR